MSTHSHAATPTTQVQEWFKNRRKKDRLQRDRVLGNRLPPGRRGRKSTMAKSSDAAVGQSDGAAVVMETAIGMATNEGDSVGVQQIGGEVVTEPAVYTVPASGL